MVEVIYAVVALVGLLAPLLAMRAKKISEGVFLTGLGTVCGWSLLSWAGSLQYTVLFYLGAFIFLASLFELALVVFSPLIAGGEEE